MDKARAFIGKGRQSGEQGGKGTQNCSATWVAVLGFMVMGLVSGLSLANPSDSGCFLVAYAMLSQDGRQRGGSWEVEGHMESPFCFLELSSIDTRQTSYLISTDYERIPF